MLLYVPQPLKLLSKYFPQIFDVPSLKYSFVKFLNTFSSFQCLYIVRFEWDIVLSSSYDGWNKHGYTMWCPREGIYTLY